jgi:glutathione S-transferase
MRQVARFLYIRCRSGGALPTNSQASGGLRTTEYRLYCFAQSGNAYKAALMLNRCGADLGAALRRLLSEREHRTQEFRQFNAMGEVPALEHEGRTFTQSGVILDYLPERFGKFG